MQVPVISATHLPQAEAEALLNLDPEDRDNAEPDDPPPGAHRRRASGTCSSLKISMRTLCGFPHLRAILLAIKTRGYSYARVDAQGELFDDLPQFDW